MAPNRLATLPPELRVRTYETRADLKVSLLCVDRFTYNEALPIFYQTNTFSVPGGDHGATFIKTSGLPNIKHLVHLHLSDFPGLETWPNGAQPCLLHALSQIPHLRTVTADYGANLQSRQAFEKFKATLKANVQSDSISLKCVGIGQYKLLNTKLPHVDMSMNDVELAEIWRSATPAHAREVMTRLVYRRDAEPTEVTELSLHGKRALCICRLLDTIELGSLKWIPRTIAAAWPKEVSVDYGKLGQVDTLGFIEVVDDAVQLWLHIVVDGYEEGFEDAMKFVQGW
ncbi:hypothetical protein LTR08_005788 [Meristemomyces frigidus]|nr:hypothetical protein LTR08_005788 [Meristemomyces frigidus]